MDQLIAPDHNRLSIAQQPEQRSAEQPQQQSTPSMINQSTSTSDLEITGVVNASINTTDIPDPQTPPRNIQTTASTFVTAVAPQLSIG
ncbi:unnamed protein product [Didymodactylos carnosus]|uniref:Uncharacterized protein n=1 Tax=Didymodactylos carnosus TaxID=1234261 RepID=A0A815WSJ1_9BILA|nr:unnamed protein product [Didymodactylos carnosus]CAF4410681.1 unnamed protein product [Didymodactylos carnosus]